MTINGCRIIYANESSDKYGMILCSIGTINTESNDEATTIITSKTSFQRKSDLHAVQYGEPLRFNLTLVREDGKYMDAYDERTLKKLLCKTERHWLKIDQDDLVDIEYYCLFTNPRKDNVAKMTGGITFSVECDWGGAWSSLIYKSYETVGSTLNFPFNFLSDFDKDILCPVMKITPTSYGNISILNNTTSQNITINNCVENEVITFDNDNNIFESTNGRVLLDDWNKKFLEFIEGINMITLTGNFKLDLTYRLPVRVGG